MDYKTGLSLNTCFTSHYDSLILWGKVGYLWLLRRLKHLGIAVMCVLLSVSLEDSLPAAERQKMVLPPRSRCSSPLLFCQVRQ